MLHLLKIPIHYILHINHARHCLAKPSLFHMIQIPMQLNILIKELCPRVNSLSDFWFNYVCLRQCALWDAVVCFIVLWGVVWAPQYPRPVKLSGSGSSITIQQFLQLTHLDFIGAFSMWLFIWTVQQKCQFISMCVHLALSANIYHLPFTIKHLQSKENAFIYFSS